MLGCTRPECLHALTDSCLGSESENKRTVFLLVTFEELKVTDEMTKAWRHNVIILFLKKKKDTYKLVAILVNILKY